MTVQSTPTTERTRAARSVRRKPSPFPVVAGSLAAFVALFGFLAYQMGTGHDPLLSAHATSPAPLTKRVVIKRIEHRIVVTKIIPPPEESDDGGGGAVVAQVPVQVPVQTSAPVIVQQSTPAPAPAPAAAPVVTRSS